jgi:MtN3 and saliva related transmembrane protein
MTEAIGWISSLILVFTIGKQVYKQWSEGKSDGVSIWLFVGQIIASVGFAVYSYLVGNWVFIFTNSLMVLNGIAGLSINLYLKNRDKTQR